MVARASVLAAGVVLLAGVSTGAAANGRLLVDPGTPVVGARAAVELHARTRGPLYAQLVSPTGVRTKLRLTRTFPGVWRAAFRFPDDGQWVVRVPRARASTRVLVFQPPAALPPYRPNTGAAATPFGPGIFLGR